MRPSVNSWANLRLVGPMALATLLAGAACGDDGSGPGATCESDCLLPPEPTCVDGVRTVYTIGGTCIDGACVFASSTEDCTAGCDANRCADDPCDDLTCEDTAPRCEGDVVVYDEATGCADGACTFNPMQLDCTTSELVCRNGTCVEPAPPDACEDVDCSVLPEPVCEGNVAVRVDDAGTCVEGACEYTALRSDCDDLDQDCVRGECVERPPCDGVVCDDPPAPACDGTTAVVATTPGLCDEETGICEYAEDRTDCALTDRFCDNGVCVDVDPCDPDDCTETPDDYCDENVAVRHLAPVCEDGACTWPTETDDCSDIGFCRDGQCFEGDPCEGVLCNSPPAPTCDGDTAVVAEATGTCTIAGECEYDLVRTECIGDLICDGGACVEFCDVESCELPSPTCDGAFAVTYREPASCVDGDCAFSQRRQNCASGGGVCVDGACVFDECATISCGAAPANECQGSERIDYGDPGVCVDGECVWPESRLDCATIDSYCSAGACVPVDPCIGVTCVRPPLARCDGEVAVTFASSGTCVDGACTYDESRDNCGARGQFCLDGACQEANPCAGVSCNSPGAAYCDGDTLRTPIGPGTCAYGECAYADTAVDCQADGGICNNARCQGAERCVGVACDDAPADYCEGNTLVDYPEPGRCLLGLCIYEPVERDCGASGDFCFEGACVDRDPCLDISCNTPPVPACDGNTAIAWAAIGDCSLGACDYGETRTDCGTTGRYCFEGACRAQDPCLGVTCFSPPAPTCDGAAVIEYTIPAACVAGECDWTERSIDCGPAPDAYCAGTVAITYADGGTCAEGACRWPTFESDCAAEDAFCANGVCVPDDPCSGVTCTSPPPRYCDGNTLRGYVNLGVCDSGDCDYAPAAPINCASLGLVCSAGACVEPPNPCAGVVCESYPADTCDGTSVMTAVRPGTCSGGACSYSMVELVDCADFGAVCTNGQCEGVDACDGINCGEAPPADCVDELTRRFYPRPPECSNGVCVNSPGFESCGNVLYGVCRDGACVIEDPCDVVVCEPPADTCFGFDTRVTYTSYCGGGACFYTETRTDCGEAEFCFDGECLPDALCDEVRCSEPPPDSCFGEKVARYSAGTCESNICDYPSTVVDCTALGQTCEDGVCVALATPSVGDLVITEFLADPNGSDAGFEWFEVTNLTDRRMDLSGLTVVGSTPGETFTVAAFSVPANGGALIASGSSPVSGLRPAVYNWGGSGVFSLDNASDVIELRVGTTVIDRLEYSVPPFPGGSGVSASLSLASYSPTANDAAGNWCASTSVWSATLTATPTGPNPTCVGTLRSDLVAGDVLISEIMVDPTEVADASGEWFELFNPTAFTLDLGGVTVRDAGTESFVFAPGTRLLPGAYLVVGRGSNAVVDGVDVVAPGLGLADDADALIVLDGAVEIDRVSWSLATGWPLRAGRSMSRASVIDAAAGVGPSGWCADFVPYGVSDAGTPGAANVDCDAHAPLCATSADCEMSTPSCAQDYAVSYSGSGVCEANGRCEFGAARVSVDCAASGEFCVGGSCVTSP